MLTHVRKRDVLLVRLEGELDQCSASGIRRDIDALLQDPSVRHLVLDMARMPFMDSSGIAVIIKLNQRMKSLGGRMWVENPAKQPLRVIDASGIDRLVPVAISK